MLLRQQFILSPTFFSQHCSLRTYLSVLLYLAMGKLGNCKKMQGKIRLRSFPRSTSLLRWQREDWKSEGFPEISKSELFCSNEILALFGPLNFMLPSIARDLYTPFTSYPIICKAPSFPITNEWLPVYTILPIRTNTVSRWKRHMFLLCCLHCSEERTRWCSKGKNNKKISTFKQPKR